MNKLSIRILTAIALLLTATSVFSQKKADTVAVPSLPLGELKKENCAESQNTFKLKKGGDFNINIAFKNATDAKEKGAHYKIARGTDTISGVQNDKFLSFSFKNPFSGIVDKSLLFNIYFISDLKKPQNKECQYMFTVAVDDKGNETAKIAPVDYAALAKELKFTLDLKALYWTPLDCVDDDYPLTHGVKLEDASKNTTHSPWLYGSLKAQVDNLKGDTNYKPANRLIYDAKENETYWFDNTGKATALSTKPHKFFSVPVGNPVAFEIINVNPLDYKLTIKDTSENYFQDANAMLFKYLSPFSSGSSGPTAAGAGPVKTEEDPKSQRINVVRAAIITIDAALNDFLLNQANSCDNYHFKLIKNKAMAKQKVDSILVAAPLNMPASRTLDQFMRIELNILKEDSSLYKVTTELYNSLSTKFYRMEYLTKAQDKDKIVFTYNILAREKTPYMNKAVNEKIDIYITNNFKVDVSTGLYYAWLKNDKYMLRADSTITTNGTKSDTVRGKKLIDDRMNAGEFGFSAYLHFYKKNSPSFSWGGHIGVGLSLDDQVKPRYFTGLSFLIGRESGRIGVNLGVAMGNVDRISNQYVKNSDNATFKMLPSSESSVQYVSKFIVRPSIGISYNIPFGLEKKTQKQSTDDTPKTAATTDTPKTAATADTPKPKAP